MKLRFNCLTPLRILAASFALFGLTAMLPAQVAVGATNTGLPVFGITNVPVTAAVTIVSTSFTSSPTVAIALPSVPAGTTVHGYCHVVWEQATAAATVSFGFGNSAAPTDQYIFSSVNYAAAGTNVVAWTTLTTATATIVGAAATPGAAATAYKADFDFVLVTGTSADIVSLYGLTSNASDALVIEPGSNCGYQS
jgi:hypothetical protein